MHRKAVVIHRSTGTQRNYIFSLFYLQGMFSGTVSVISSDPQCNEHRYLKVANFQAKSMRILPITS